MHRSSGTSLSRTVNNECQQQHSPVHHTNNMSACSSLTIGRRYVSTYLVTGDCAGSMLDDIHLFQVFLKCISPCLLRPPPLTSPDFWHPVFFAFWAGLSIASPSLCQSTLPAWKSPDWNQIIHMGGANALPLTHVLQLHWVSYYPLQYIANVVTY